MADTVTVMQKVEYRAWQVPRFASLDMPARPKQEGVQELPSIPVAELPAAALDALARQWLDHLYASVERASPFKLIGGSND